MNTAYLHVVINHLPIMGVPIGVGLLALGLYARNEAIKRAALLVFVAIGVATVAVYLAGQGGEEFVEHLPGVSEDAIEAHEEMAGMALFATEGLALLSLLAFMRFGGPAMLSRSPKAVVATSVPAWAAWLVLVAGVATSAVLGYTGKLGGQIRHTEFVDAAAQGEHEEEDDGGRRGRR
jgi:uncharacterized membrane protein